MFAAMMQYDEGLPLIMPAGEVVRASLTGGCLRGCLSAVGGQLISGRTGRGLGVAALFSWLLAESLGAYMFRSWLMSIGSWRPSAGRSKRQETGAQDTMSPALVLGHASLALAGLISWVSFLASGQPALAWLAIGLVAPAIGLGISTVTVWTPYPLKAPRADQPAEHPGAKDRQGSPAILVTNEMLDRALTDEAMTSKLVDDLLERMLTEPATREVASRKWRLAPVIPILHGILALATFLLTVLAAIAASA
jgi:hypothetical protein